MYIGRTVLSLVQILPKTNLFSTSKHVLFVFGEFAHQVVDHPGAHSYHDGDEDEDDDDVLGLGEVDGDAPSLPGAARLLIPTKLAVPDPVAQQALICQNWMVTFWIGWLIVLWIVWYFDELPYHC